MLVLSFYGVIELSVALNCLTIRTFWSSPSIYSLAVMSILFIADEGLPDRSVQIVRQFNVMLSSITP